MLCSFNHPICPNHQSPKVINVIIPFHHKIKHNKLLVVEPDYIPNSYAGKKKDTQFMASLSHEGAEFFVLLQFKYCDFIVNLDRSL
jgi:hypothetical protein